jgi:hypothetical protein
MVKPSTRRKTRRTAEVIALPRGGNRPANDNGPLAAMPAGLPAPSRPVSSYPSLGLFWPTSVFFATWAWWCGGL